MEEDPHKQILERLDKIQEDLNEIKETLKK